MGMKGKGSIIKSVIFAVFITIILMAANVYAKPGGNVPGLLSEKQVLLKEGRTSQIKISGNNIIKVKYASSDKLIATVNKKGKVTAKSTGACKINIKVFYKENGKKRGKKLEVNVKVKKKEDNNLKSFKVSINNKEFGAKLYNTDAGKEFYNQLPVTINMSELNGNEKFYYMDKTFTEDSGKAGLIKAGDIMLYGDNCLVLFYETFQSSYTYTKIGYIEEPAGLAEEVGKKEVEVSFLK